MRISIINPIIFKLFLSYFSSTKHPRLFSSSLNYREYFHLSTKHPEHVSGWVGLDSNKKKKTRPWMYFFLHLIFFSLHILSVFCIFFGKMFSLEKSFYAIGKGDVDMKWEGCRATGSRRRRGSVSERRIF